MASCLPACSCGTILYPLPVTDVPKYLGLHLLHHGQWESQMPAGTVKGLGALGAWLPALNSRPPTTRAKCMGIENAHSTAHALWHGSLAGLCKHNAFGPVQQPFLAGIRP